MNPTSGFAPALLMAAAMAVMACHAMAQNDADPVAVARSVLKADRQEIVAQTMQLTEMESKTFWPLYHRYRMEMDKVSDGLVKLVQEYAAYYPDVPEDRARKMLKTLGDLEKKKAAPRASCLKKFSKVLPPAKTLRFAEVENRLDLAVQLEMASVIPLVPIEGRLGGETTRTTATGRGIPGGTVVETYEVTATVSSIDRTNRKVTLVDPAGIKQTVKAGPEVINFDQIRLGDRLRVVSTVELVVSVAGEDETANDAAAQLVALVPKGAKPGGIMAETRRVTGKVTALDIANRKATLQFDDGTTRTVAARDDVDLSRRKAGDRVVVHTTESLAIRIERP